MPESKRNRAVAVLGCVLVMTGSSLSACQRSTTVDVSLHGVNYSGDTFSYSVSDPATPGRPAAGGELIDPFAAGGTMCCATLPLTWRPGLKLQVNVTNWRQEQPPDGELVETKETHLVEVPAYPDGKPGEVWVLRAVDGGISAVLSDVQPDHPKWAGKVKGWPVPSLKYRQERWKIILTHEQNALKDALLMLEDLKKDPLGRASASWEFAKQHDRERIEGFTGPHDPRYLEIIRKSYEESVKHHQNQITQLLKAAP
ncbi:MAG: DUF3304 domain-containing protein [Janthinobacterium lividum]